MTNEVLIISPELKAGTGGLADYALRVVAEWGEHARVRFIDPKELPASGGKILLHYSAYGFDRIGYPRAFLRSLLKWKRATGGLLVIMFHEIWTFWPILNKNYLVQRFHRADLRKLISIADAVFTSTPSQAEHLLALVPTSEIQVLPVGSNIRPLSSNSPREEGLAVLFGLQNTRVRTLKTMQADLTALAKAKRIEKIIVVGQSNNADGEESALLEKLRLTNGFEHSDALPEAEVSHLLARASFGLSAQDELSLHKSGTFMAYAAHGLNILSPCADAMAPEPLCWMVRPGDLVRGISADELRDHAQNLRAWQERTASWPEIAHHFAEALHFNHPA